MTALDAHIVVERGGGFRLDAEFSLAPGETVALLGPSGAGKSTLLDAVAGLARLAEGGIRLGDRELASAERRVHIAPAARHIALLGQDPRLFPHLSARENIAFGPRAQGVPKQRARSDADDWLIRVDLDGLGDRRPAQLSGGQQQRVALARALVTSPRLLLLDEPLTALDPGTAAEVRAVILDELGRTQTTAILVTHDLIDAVALAHRVVVLEAGRITEQGPTADALAAPQSAFLRTATGAGWRETAPRA